MTRYKFIRQQLTGGDKKYVVLTTEFALNMSVQVNSKAGIIDPIFTG